MSELIRAYDSDNNLLYTFLTVRDAFDTADRLRNIFTIVFERKGETITLRWSSDVFVYQPF